MELTGKTVLAGLKKVKGVEQVTKEDGNKFRIVADGKKDIRPTLFKLAEEKKWTLLGMREIERQLDEVFSELTQGE